jgi:hypothetical protein
MVQDLNKTVIKLRSDGIMEFDLKPCDSFSVDDLKEINAAADLLGGGQVFPRVVYINHFIDFGREVRVYAASEESNLKTSAVAFVVYLLVLKFVGNFYITFNKPNRPTRIFDSKEEAIEWLRTFLQ